MENYRSFVTTAETQLKAEGVPLSGPIGDEAESDKQKGILTGRTAWLIYQTDKDVGLLEKTGGANWQGRSSDRLMSHRNGDLVDICSTRDEPAEGKFYVTTGWSPDDAPVDTARWIEPTREMASLPPGEEPGGGNGEEPGGGNVDTAAILKALAEHTQQILARDDQNTQRILDRLDQIVAGFDAAVKKVLALWLAQNADGVPPEGGQNLLLLLILKALAGEPEK